LERCSLHPLDLTIVRTYAEAVLNDFAPAAGRNLSESIDSTQEIFRNRARERAPEAHRLTVGLAAELARAYPSFVQDGWGLTIYEARVERGVGMYLRPPSRLFRDAGLADNLARRLPIRLEFNGMPMGGAFVPARLVSDLRALLDQRGERLVRRLVEAERNPIASLGLFLEACDYAIDRGLGLYEATGVPADAGGLVLADPSRLAPERRSRLEAAMRPPRKAGLLERLLHRDSPGPARQNGHIPPG
jgi:hypothetical protein